MDTAELYQRIIRIVTLFTQEAYSLTINELDGLDPTVEELTKDLKFLSELLDKISKDDYSEINMRLNAAQCVIFMELVSTCINDNNQEDLDKYMVELEKHAKW
jgi:hypothetical protein